MKETLFCQNCSKHTTFYTELKSNQNTARCTECGTFIKNIPYQPPMFYVGKYKGIPIDEIEDIGYLQWALQKMSNLKGRTRDAVQSRISQLEFLGK